MNLIWEICEHGKRDSLSRAEGLYKSKRKMEVVILRLCELSGKFWTR